MPQFIVTTLGCKVNQYESAAIRQTLRRLGLDDHDGAGPVVVCVVHTCCVTAVAARKSRQLIRRLAAAHPDADLVVSGCYATAGADLLRRISGVTAVVGHADDLAAHLARTVAKRLGQPATRGAAPSRQASTSRGEDCRQFGEHQAAPSTASIRPFSGPPVKAFQAPGTANLDPLTAFPDRRRAMVKVQDGCDGFCTYCIIPHLRTRLASRPAADVLDEVGALVDAGHREIVLCGVNLGAYGWDTVRRSTEDGGSGPLAELIAAVADIDGVDRVRLSSLGPADVDERLLEVMADKSNVCNHLHMSLQSGSTPVLRRMNRLYTAEQFCRTVDRIRSRLVRPAITTDVIVGFPGESKEDFESTLQVCKYSGFTKIHSFPFSPREGTPAAGWSAERPGGDAVKARMGRLAAVEAELAEAFRAQFVGETVGVLLEEMVGPAAAAGLTERYLRTEVGPVGAALVGRVVPVRVTEYTAEGLVGRLAGEDVGLSGAGQGGNML